MIENRITPQTAHMLREFFSLRGSFGWLTTLLVGFVIATLTTNLTAQTVDKEKWKRGYQGLAMLCRANDIEIVDDKEDWREEDARKTALLVLGDNNLRLDLRRYLDIGGTLIVASDQSEGRYGDFRVNFHPGPHYTFTSMLQSYRGHQDCPVVRQFPNRHPLTNDLTSIVTNRTGYMSVRQTRGGRDRYDNNQVIAELPMLQNQGSQSHPFMVEVTSSRRNRGKALFIGDQSIFSNQMLVCGDNARFAVNLANWIGDGKKLMIISGQDVINPFDPTDVELSIPPPTKEQVLAMLRSLPPDVLIDFANEVTILVEDEGFLNELAAFGVEQIPGRVYRRSLILIPTIILGVLLIGRLRRGSTIDLDEIPVPGEQQSKQRARQERKMAVGKLLDQFRVDLSGNSSTSWQSFVWCVNIPDDVSETRRFRRVISRIARRYETGKTRYWSRKRLRLVARKIDHWRRLHGEGKLQYHVISSAEHGDRHPI